MMFKRDEKSAALTILFCIFLVPAVGWTAANRGAELVYEKQEQDCHAIMLSAMRSTVYDTPMKVDLETLKFCNKIISNDGRVVWGE